MTRLTNMDGPSLLLEMFRLDVLDGLDKAARRITENPLAMGATDQDLPELFRLVDRLFDDVMARQKGSAL
jgi:hypothetical protein